ncbi:MAG: hypothetical protein JW913_02350 [Chitinispirillaceae bacterium]|nr:hypothetical protein [Chitinispirillaceae bacterium]
METTERIVKAYVRYIKKWATIPNIRCNGQFEIDLLAIDPVINDRYHIESGVSVSGSYSKLTSKPFSSDDLKVRVKQAGQRRTLGYFIERKFNSPGVLSALKTYGFKKGNYSKVIVTWGWAEGVQSVAEIKGITLWDFRKIIHEIAHEFENDRTYFTDDTLRTLHLYAAAEKYNSKDN